MSEEIVNKVANSGLITIDLEDWYPENVVTIDMAQFLFHGLILKAKEFREAIKTTNWQSYQNKFVSIICTADAIVPTWAFMLISINLQPFAKKIAFGSEDKMIEEFYTEKINSLDLSEYADKRIIIKGCSKKNVPVSAHVKLAAQLQPVVKSLMFGEPCSTVPLYKKASQNS